MAKSELTFVNVSGEAIRQLRTQHGLSVAKLAANARIGKTTINNIEHHVTQQMLAEGAKRIARALRVTLKEISTTQKVESRNAALGALGLVESPTLESDDVPYQSFEFTRDNQPVAMQWVDCRGNSLTPSLGWNAKSGERWLSLAFSGNVDGWASVIAINPLNHTPRENTYAQGFLGFAARLIRCEEATPLAIAVRLVDRKGREWVLGSSKTFGYANQEHLFALDPEHEWTPCIIRLSPQPSSYHRWYLFRETSADHSPNLRPDWSCVARVVLAIGVMRAECHPSPGNGEIQVSPIWLGSEQAVERHLPKKGRRPGSSAVTGVKGSTKRSTKREPRGR